MFYVFLFSKIYALLLTFFGIPDQHVKFTKAMKLRNFYDLLVTGRLTYFILIYLQCLVCDISAEVSKTTIAAIEGDNVTLPCITR